MSARVAAGGATILGVAAVLFLPNCGAPPSATIPPTALTLQTVDGEELDIAPLCKKGEALVLSFWARWCAPCIREFPSLQALYREGARRHLHLIAVEVGSDREIVRDFVKDAGVTFPVALDDSRDVAKRFQVDKLPTVVVLGHGCRVLYKGIGGLPPGMAANLIAGLQ